MVIKASSRLCSKARPCTLDEKADEDKMSGSGRDMTAKTARVTHRTLGGREGGGHRKWNDGRGVREEAGALGRLLHLRWTHATVQQLRDYRIRPLELGGGGEGGGGDCGKAAARASAGCNTVQKPKPSTTKTPTARSLHGSTPLSPHIESWVSCTPSLGFGCPSQSPKWSAMCCSAAIGYSKRLSAELLTNSEAAMLAKIAGKRGWFGRQRGGGGEGGLQRRGGGAAAASNAMECLLQFYKPMRGSKLFYC
jgi:hypothetical protein